MPIRLPLALPLFAVLISGFAHASEHSPWYAGVALGQSQNSVQYDFFPDRTSEKKTDIGGKIYGGYRFNQYFATELEYVQFGTYRSSSRTIASSVKTSGLGLSAIGSIPFGADFSLFGKAGAMAKFTKTHETYTFDSDVYRQNSTRFLPVLGLGVDYKIAARATLRAEYLYAGKTVVGENDLKIENGLLSIGLHYHF